MKLVELSEYYDFLTYKGDYSQWLSDQGYKIPEIKGKGFVLVLYGEGRKITKKSYSNLDSAEDNAPTQLGKHWQIYNGSTGEVAKEPEWWHSNQYIFRRIQGDE